jgi:hypothetical protein
MIFGNKELEKKVEKLEHKIDQLEQRYDNLFLNLAKFVYPCSHKVGDVYNGLTVTRIESRIIERYKQIDWYRFTKAIEYTIRLKNEKDGNFMNMVEHFEIEGI